MTMRYGASRAGLPASAVLPWYLQFPGQGKRIAGQTGGRMGDRHNAFLIQGDFAKADYQIEGLQLRDDLPWERMRRRHGFHKDFHRTDCGVQPRQQIP